MKISQSLIFIPFVFVNSIHAQMVKMYVGTYTTDTDSKGVYIYNFDQTSGRVEFVETIPMSNPSFMTRRDNILYVVNEDIEGMVTVYDLDAKKTISYLSTNGKHPCHIALSPRDPITIVTNYSSGSLSLYSLRPDGSIRSMDDFIAFKGSSINKSRQKESHIHSAFFNNSGSQVYISDLGMDMIYVFDINYIDGQYKLHKSKVIKTKLGGGPRHLVLSGDERTLYSVLELTGEIQVFKLINGEWIAKQTIAMYPPNFEGSQGGADIRLSPNGKILYATNRGTANYIVAMQVKNNGLLKVYKINNVQGESPRNLNISPNSNFVLVANQDTDNISIFENTSNEPFLNWKPVENELRVPKPVCISF